VGRVTDDGSDVLEIRVSREECDRSFAEVVRPARATVSSVRARRGEPVVTEFEPRGLIIPSAAIAV
jgi:hypothetical protein